MPCRVVSCCAVSCHVMSCHSSWAACQVVTSLPPPGEGTDLSYGSREEQLDLLSRVLSAGDEAGREEELAEDVDDLRHAPTQVKRTAASMSAMSGAGGMMYMEYSTGGRGGGGQGGRGGGKAAASKEPQKRHSLFKQRYT